MLCGLHAAAAVLASNICCCCCCTQWRLYSPEVAASLSVLPLQCCSCFPATTHTKTKKNHEGLGEQEWKHHAAGQSSVITSKLCTINEYLHKQTAVISCYHYSEDRLKAAGLRGCYALMLNRVIGTRILRACYMQCMHSYGMSSRS